MVVRPGPPAAEAELIAGKAISRRPLRGNIGSTDDGDGMAKYIADHERRRAGNEVRRGKEAGFQKGW